MVKDVVGLLLEIVTCVGVTIMESFGKVNVRVIWLSGLADNHNRADFWPTLSTGMPGRATAPVSQLMPWYCVLAQLHE